MPAISACDIRRPFGYPFDHPFDLAQGRAQDRRGSRLCFSDGLEVNEGRAAVLFRAMHSCMALFAVRNEDFKETLLTTKTFSVIIVITKTF